MIQLKDLTLLGIVKSPKSLKVFAEKPATIFGSKLSCMLWKGVMFGDLKYFFITDSTRKRILNIPVDKINGGNLIDLKNKPSSGCVYFSDGLHYIYHIRDNGVYIMSSHQKRKHIVDDPNFYASQTMEGFLYFDFFSESSHCYINSILDAINNKDHLLLKDKTAVPQVKKIEKALKENDTKLIEQYRYDYQIKWNNTKQCLQSFMFIHFAKVIDTTRISSDFDLRTFSQKIKNPKASAATEVIRVDTFYDETLHVINPFSVSGHFRNQPVGVGRKETKLIYIDSFMKTGYTRIATKEKIFKD